MSQKASRLILLFPWSLLILLALGYVVFWNDIPDRMAIHFGLQGKANGWMDRQAFLGFSFIFLFLELSIFTALLMHLRFVRIYKRVIALYYFCTTGEAGVFWLIIRSNISDTQISWAWVAGVALALISVSLCAFKLSQPFETSSPGFGVGHKHI